MNKIKVETIVVGPIRTNCYLLINEETKETVIVDPGDNAQKIIQKVRENQGMVKAILLTHGHFDHILAAKQVSSEFAVKIYASESEIKLIEDMDMNCSVEFGSPFTLQVSEGLKDGQILNLLGTNIEVIYTPGHTKGSVCYYIKEEKILLSGDTLFFESVGRTDLPTGSSMQIITSVLKRLYTLPDDVMVYPGHGCSTDIGYEKQNNPYA